MTVLLTEHNVSCCPLGVPVCRPEAGVKAVSLLSLTPLSPLFSPLSPSLPSFSPSPILFFLSYVFFPFSYISRWIFKVRVCKSASHSYIVKSHSFTRRVVLGAQQPPPLHLQLPRGCHFLISELIPLNDILMSLLHDCSVLGIIHGHPLGSGGHSSPPPPPPPQCHIVIWQVRTQC